MTVELSVDLPSGAMLIGADWVEEASGGTFDHVNPATGQVQHTIPIAGKEEVDRAVVAARGAWPKWRAIPADERRDVLLRIGGLLREQAGSMAVTSTLENGMPSTFSPLVCGSVVPDYFFYFAGWTEKIEGSVIPVYPATALDYTLPGPYGVIGAIIPWNGPLGSIGMKVAPALAAGNCVVLKPPELAPFTSLRFAELCLEAGLPPGVVNVLPGGVEAGDALVRHPGIDKITFTGGTESGRQVLIAAAEHMTPAVLELGGKSAAILFPDADLGAAVPMSVMFSVVAMSGQGCSLGTRLLVHDSIYDEVVEGLQVMVQMLVVGDPLDPATQMGPVISARHCDRILGVIERARASQSGTLVAGGERLGGALADGFFLPPTLFVDVDPDSELAQEEIFGPVLSVMRFRDEAEAVTLANRTRYGLAAYLWTSDLKRAHRLAGQLDAGTVAINGIFTNPANAPFGGMKGSGYGREGGRLGLEEFLRVKNVYLPLD